MKHYNETMEILQECERKIFKLRDNFKMPEEYAIRTLLFSVDQQIFGIMETINTYVEKEN